MDNARSTWPENRVLWVMMSTSVRCQIDGQRRTSGNLPSSEFLGPFPYKGCLFSERKDINAKAGS